MSDGNQIDPQLQMRNLLMGFVVSRALQVAAEVGVADALAEGPKDRDALAREVGAHADTMNRLMRTLLSLGVFDQLPDGRFVSTPRSEYLRGDVPGSLRGLARMYGDSALWQAWAGLETQHSFRRDELRSCSRITYVRVSRGASRIRASLRRGNGRLVALDERSPGRRI
jgi:hypothetical protein